MKYTNFKLKLRAFLAVFVMLFFCVSANAQKLSLTGVVRDAVSGEPILGANILEKGTTNGTITNLDGEFSLTLSPNATLVVKYVGYQPQEIQVAGQKTIVVKLQEDAVVLGEVVAIGYATVKKNDATGSITAIKPDKLNKGLTTNAQDMITGKIAGVNVTSNGGAPGAGATIRIRGGSSLSASNDPLIVIDGLTIDNEGIKGVSNPLSTINPNDIESFTVLKDASATAIYGSRASNGVIIITTKRGEKGSKPRITYDGNTSVGVVGKTLDVLNGDEYRDYVTKLYGTNSDAYRALGNANTDWQSQIYRTAIGHDHSVSITGGLKSMPYRASVGYTNQNGIIKTSNFERFTGAFSINPSFFEDHLKLNINAKGMIVNNRFADQGVIGAAASMDPTKPVMSNEEPYKTTFGGYWQWITSGTTFNSLAVQNPLATLNLKEDKANAYNLIGNFEADYKLHFLPDMRAHLNLGIDRSYGKQDLYIPLTSPSDNQMGRTGFSDQLKNNQILTFFVDYAKEAGLHSVNAMAGYEWQHYYRSGEWNYTALDLVTNPSAQVWKTENYLVSFFGRLNYTFANKYLLTATVRNDGSSRFAPETRWGIFPSFAFAWKIMEEDFMKGNTTFSDLKLRLGYGVTGQQNINNGDYPYIPTYTENQEGAYYPMDGAYVTTYRPGAFNKNLKWEETTTYNAGIDWGVLNNRLTGTIDYYQRVTDDLINIVDIPAGTNFKNRVISNIGSLENKGVEVSITGKPVVTKDLQWDVNYNFTYNSNKITKLTTGSQEGYYVATGGISSGTGNNVQAHSVGYPASSFYVYEQVYDNGGKPIEGLYVDRNGDNVINDDDRYFFHNPNADFTMGFSSKLIYKDFDFGFTLRASVGNFVYNDVAADGANVGQSGVWSTSGFLANKPQSAFETNFVGRTNWYFSDYYVQNASFLRCDNITLGYSFKKVLNVIQSGRLSATLQNPFVITKYKGLDPEIFGGIDNNVYPRPVMTVIGLTLNF